MLNLFSKVRHNQAVIRTLPSGFTDEEFCLDGIAFVNDQIELLNSNTNGVSWIKYKTYNIIQVIWYDSTGLHIDVVCFKVCITGLYQNANQILVGKNNDQESFWLTNNHVDCNDNHMTRIIHVNYRMKWPNSDEMTQIQRFSSETLVSSVFDLHRLLSNNNLGYLTWIMKVYFTIRIIYFTWINLDLSTAMIVIQNGQIISSRCKMDIFNGEFCSTWIQLEFQLELHVEDIHYLYYFHWFSVLFERVFVFQVWFQRWNWINNWIWALVTIANVYANESFAIVNSQIRTVWPKTLQNVRQIQKSVVMTILYGLQSKGS